MQKEETRRSTTKSEKTSRHHHIFDLLKKTTTTTPNPPYIRMNRSLPQVQRKQTPQLQIRYFQCLTEDAMLLIEEAIVLKETRSRTRPMREREREREAKRESVRYCSLKPNQLKRAHLDLAYLVLVESAHYDSDFFQASQKDLTLLNAINLRLECAIGPYILSLMYNAHTYLLMHIPTYLLWHLPPYWGELNLLLLFELHITAHYQCQPIILFYFLCFHMVFNHSSLFNLK
jgi:hypothetical protein